MQLLWCSCLGKLNLENVSIWKSEWGGAIFFSHGSTHSKGVSISINPSSKQKVEVTGKDLDGRIVSFNLIYNSGKISICNIYAPNDSQQQQKFLLTLNRYLMSYTEISNLIVGGDWNVTLTKRAVFLGDQLYIMITLS